MKHVNQANPLAAQWQQMAGQWDADRADIEAVFRLLLTTYSDVNRHYHGIGHIEQMLQQFEVHQSAVSQPDSFYFAIWFHDFIQQHSVDNEQLSAELAAEYLQRLLVPQAIIQRCQQLILATRQHRYVDDSDVQLFIDIDLSILASERAAYRSYAYRCRKEYFLPQPVYRFGRRRFLKQLLARRFIFASDVFRHQAEARARANIQWELECWL